MIYKPYFLITDILYFILLFASIYAAWRCRKTNVFQQLKLTLYSRKGLCAFMIIAFYFLIATLDCMHFSVEHSTEYFSKGSIVSALDIALKKSYMEHEKTYSKPLATHLFVAEKTNKENASSWQYPTLNITKQHVGAPSARYNSIFKPIVIAFFITTVIVLGFYFMTYKRRKKYNRFPWRVAFSMVFIFLFLSFLVMLLSSSYHLLGTDKVGNDILYVSLKSIRTAVLLGSLTILITLPFAVFLGMGAGFLGGRIDDAIQFIYTVLSAIPSVLLIIAGVLSLQVFIDRHHAFFSTMLIRADVRLLLLCFILGLTSWTSLCRVIRAETLKIRELEYVQAAKVLGTSTYKILIRHIFPNILHIILITVILDFSMLILAEAVLTYVGVGVDPTTYSWGNMIDAARMELARTPIVWWPLVSAFSFMFLFVLAINIYVDVLRSKLDPRER